MSGLVNGTGLATFVDTSQSLDGVNELTTFCASTNVVPAVATTPESGSLLLLGTGLLSPQECCSDDAENALAA